MSETPNYECKGCGSIITSQERPKKCSACGSYKVLLISQEEGKSYEQRVSIKLPGEGKLISEFANELANELKDKNTLFIRESSMDVLEIDDIVDKENKEEYVEFKIVKPERFVTLTEKYITPYMIRVKKTDNGNEYQEREKSMTPTIAKTVLMSETLQSELPKIKRILTTPIPIIYNGELTFPKKGYDQRFSSWMPYNAPELNKDMTLEEAKILIKEIYQEFCFQDKQDFVNAVAGLFTPFLRGLLPSFTTRTPVFIYMANRERAGKDYCADITGLVMEGHAMQEPPISSGEKSSNNNEELRKKVMSAMIAGRKRLHFANNKGYINNAVFEGIITAQKYSDRALGRNEILTFDNEIDFSLSGNVGIGFTADLANRSRLVRLFLDIEDANSRKFGRPCLHAWILENRSKILSALYTFVRVWDDKGRPEGDIPFSSFPDWAKICGGIMECVGFDSPCKTEKDLLRVGGDSETQDMKVLYELAYEKFPEQWIDKQEIRRLVMNNEENLFSYFDFNSKSDQTKFGVKLSKFVGRMFSDIILKVDDENKRSSRQKLIFTKEKSERDMNEIFKI